MASRALNYLGSATKSNGMLNRSVSTSAVHDKPKSWKLKGQFAPVYIALGLITMSVSLGLYTMKHELVYSPGVTVNKKKRNTVPEVIDPDRAIDEADKFVNKSFFRKVFHVQDFDQVRTRTSDPVRPEPLRRVPEVDSMKSVGVDPNPIRH